MITKMSEGSTVVAAVGGTIVRRNLPGTKTASYSKWAEEPFDEMDSTLAVQQYIQQTIRKDAQGNAAIEWPWCAIIDIYIRCGPHPPSSRYSGRGSVEV